MPSSGSWFALAADVVYIGGATDAGKDRASSGSLFIADGALWLLLRGLLPSGCQRLLQAAHPMRKRGCHRHALRAVFCNPSPMKKAAGLLLVPGDSLSRPWRCYSCLFYNPRACPGN